MNGHDEYLELLAASIDFGLTEEEVARLNYHLASCPECRRAATELRGQNAVIATTPIAPLAPARSEQILRAALRKPAARPRWGMLAVAALLATLAGGVAFAGVRLINNDPAPSEPPPSQVAEASLPPSEAPVEESADPGAPPPAEGPRVTPNPGVDEQPETDPVDFEFPLPLERGLGPVRVAPVPGGGLWVTFQQGRGTVGAYLDDAGQGSPWVEPNAEGCEPFAVRDGSLRMLCQYSDEENPEECVDVCSVPRLYSRAVDGDDPAGFEVSLPSGISTGVNGGRVVGTDFVTVVTESYDEVVAEFGEFGSARLVTVGADGAMRDGVNVPAPLMCCTIGPDGVAYGSSSLDDEGLETRTQLIAFDQNGMRPGWPVVVDGTASSPSFGPNGQLVYSSWIDEASRIVRLNPDGSQAGDPVDVGITVDWDPNADAPSAPLVDENGRVRLVAQGQIYGYDANGDALDGFPYEPKTGLLERGNECGATDTGCQSWLEPPRLAPQGLTYALESAPDGEGGRITVINRDGSIRSGWPKTLQREGASWDSVTIGENRIAYAVAIEPEPNDNSSISVLAFAPNGTREWITTLVEP
jgi:hypothetical protein